MNPLSPEKTINGISAIIHNVPLASSIHESIASALNSPDVHISVASTVWDMFNRSLDSAIRDIENHERGKLFRRLIEYGPHHPDDPESLESYDETTLSDPECGLCVQFIFSHMVNRFKGELAELLSIKPCLELVSQLQNDGVLPRSTDLYLGNMVQERRRIKVARGQSETRWGSFAKGADGLIVKQMPSHRRRSESSLNILGVIEVKSMSSSKKKVLTQIKRHISRLNGGVKLGGSECHRNQLDFSSILRIMVIPSTWKLSREWHSIETEQGRKIVLPEPSEPQTKTHIEELQPDTWKIRLAWSQESLDQAAYEMTFWYMSQVGKHVYGEKDLPRGWEYMTPEEAGYNAIKMMLYYIPLRHIKERQERLAIKLYNVYSFGYPLGVDSKALLWPDDFPDNERNQKGIN